MSGTFGRLGNRVVIAVGLILLVGAVVAIARFAGGPVEAGQFNNGAAPTSTVHPTEGDDGEVELDPTPTVYADDATVRDVAAAFTAEWLHRERAPAAWHAALKPLSTTNLARSLDGVDPAGVPATRTTGPVTIGLRSDLFAQVSIPVDTGTLALGLVRGGSRWFVDQVDWERA